MAEQDEIGDAARPPGTRMVPILMSPRTGTRGA